MSPLNRRLLWVKSGDLSPGGIKNTDYNPSYPNPSPGHKPEEMRSETIQRSLTKSKTILQLLSSKFRVRSRTTVSNPSRPLFRSPTRISSAFGSKEIRDAALRERGLLPPSKPSVDLSLAERERDRHLPVLMPPEDEEVFAGDAQGSRISAAAKVKQEWEFKLRDDRGPERMEDPTFGDMAPSPVKDVSPPAIVWPSASLVQPSTCCETLNLLPNAITTASTIKSPPTPFNSSINNLDDPDLQTPPQLPFSSDEPHLIPLPPSPSSSSSFLNSREEIFTVPLSLSPSSEISTSPASPTISITPPVITPLHSSTGSEALHSMPGFHAASPAMTAPHVTSDTMLPSLFEKDDVLMTESPIEAPLPGSNSISGRPRDSGNFEVALAPDISSAGSTDLPKARPRNFTDPTGLRIHQVEPCKSSSYPMKRSTDPPPTTNLPRRLSIRASINNLRRSFVGTLSRAKSPGLSKADKGFGPSHLPPSPVASIDQTSVDQVEDSKLSQTQSPASPELNLRISVSPTFYSRGTIVAETNNIEDEESRRMTELAFLG
ncbi:hypothetical protein C0992_000642 [Termitomyces sp. T32_za158]|nr:hypothetical protein C0992_000642 [Termitomyces sp. T32_za158]